MRRQEYQIKLKSREKKHLKELLRKGTEKARKLTRCRILLLSSDGKTQGEISDALSITPQTVRNICSRYLSEGLESSINEKPRSGQPKIFDGRAKAKITALACSKTDSGEGQWSLRLLADRAVELGIVDSISHSTIKNILKKTK